MSNTKHYRSCNCDYFCCHHYYYCCYFIVSFIFSQCYLKYFSFSFLVSLFLSSEKKCSVNEGLNVFLKHPSSAFPQKLLGHQVGELFSILFPHFILVVYFSWCWATYWVWGCRCWILLWAICPPLCHMCHSLHLRQHISRARRWCYKITLMCHFSAAGLVSLHLTGKKLWLVLCELL